MKKTPIKKKVSEEEDIYCISRVGSLFVQYSLTWTIIGDELPGTFTATERYTACLPLRGPGFRGLLIVGGRTISSFFTRATSLSVFCFTFIPPKIVNLVLPNQLHFARTMPFPEAHNAKKRRSLKEPVTISEN